MKRWVLPAVVLAAFGCGIAADHSGLLSSAKSAIWPRPAIDPITYRSEQYASRMAFFAASPARADIVMLGDSITEFGDWKEMFPNYSILNRGIRGDTSYGVLDRINEVVSRHPYLVFLMIGVNDLSLGFSTSAVSGNIAKIVDRLHVEGIDVIVQSVLYVDENPALNAKIGSLNAGLKGQFQFADINQALSPLPNRTWDGVHPNGEAYICWRDAISSAIATHAH